MKGLLHMAKAEYLFVYGTLMHKTRGGMYSLLSSFSDFIGEGTFNGKLFLVDDYPGAIPSSDPEDIVYGEIYKLNNPKYLLQKLDKYEECSDDFPKPTEYVRKMVVVKLYNGDLLNAWIYLYNRTTERLKRIKSGNYLEIQ